MVLWFAPTLLRRLRKVGGTGRSDGRLIGGGRCGIATVRRAEWRMDREPARDDAAEDALAEPAGVLHDWDCGGVGDLGSGERDQEDPGGAERGGGVGGWGGGWGDEREVACGGWMGRGRGQEGVLGARAGGAPYNGMKAVA